MITVAELLTKIDAGERLLLLDVRNDEEFARWRVEGRHDVQTFHRPYFDFINDDALLDEVPRDKGPVYAICAKGDSSDLIAEMLRDRGADAQNVAGGMLAYGEYLQPVEIHALWSGAPQLAGRRRAEARRSTRVAERIWQLNRRGKGCLSYVIERDGEAVIVDPSRNVGAYDEFVGRLGVRLVGVFDTHVHADHISGGRELARRHGAKYGEDCFGLRILHTPGHTPSSTSLLAGDRYLLTGDTLFVDSVGRPDLGGQVVEWGKMLFTTLTQRIAGFDDDVVVLPAHYASVAEIDADGAVRGRLGHLRRTVPELQIRSESEFIDAIRKAVKTPPAIYDEIIKVNLGFRTVGAEEASEWELGKNECAAKAKRVA